MRHFINTAATLQPPTRPPSPQTVQASRSYCLKKNMKNRLMKYETYIMAPLTVGDSFIFFKLWCMPYISRHCHFDHDCFFFYCYEITGDQICTKFCRHSVVISAGNKKTSVLQFRGKSLCCMGSLIVTTKIQNKTFPTCFTGQTCIKAVDYY